MLLHKNDICTQKPQKRFLRVFTWRIGQKFIYFPKNDYGSVKFKGHVEYSTDPKAPKICQMTSNKYFDEKLITIRCVVLAISNIEKSVEL